LFFFQAEDGIRDFHVTGVQTCALPIYLADDMIIILAEIDISQTIGSHAHHKPERCRRSGTVLYPVNAIARKEAYLAAFRDVVHEIGRASCRERGEVWGGAVVVKEEGEE